ncbi:GNAT family N-acetyltransferase [Marinilactibacillus piezotolerans]|uniref:GNAT family N-acetyltransferase n=1 Tax=Marinilactibacillus piezotolerans TaxID=258723 RepID=UPI0009AFBFA9|nr:GNAT family N-acetyltransferase [Marinilactibacillus piezotolerans]
MEFKKVTTNMPEYLKSLELRNLVLRKPLGLDIKEDDLTKEPLAAHFVAVEGEKVIGTLFLMPDDNKDYQMKQVAVDPEHQGKAIGKRLVETAETWAIQQQGSSRIWLHARQNAWPFYKKSGYHFISETYRQVGIIHKTMEKRLNSCKRDAEKIDYK